MVVLMAILRSENRAKISQKNGSKIGVKMAAKKALKMVENSYIFIGNFVIQIVEKWPFLLCYTFLVKKITFPRCKQSVTKSHFVLHECYTFVTVLLHFFDPSVTPLSPYISGL